MIGTHAAKAPRRDPDLEHALHDVFDPDHYLRTYPDVAAAGMDPFKHYMRHGWQEGRDPTPWFDVHHYLGKAGLRLGEANPLVHYLTEGRARGLPPRLAPDPAPDLAPGAAGGDRDLLAGPGASWPVPEGARPGPRPAPAAHHPGPERILEDPVLAGALRRAFDASFYLARTPDAGAAGLDPLHHYLRDGWRQGLDPAPWFSTDAYLAQDPGLLECGVAPFVHYLALGRAQGRNPAPRPIVGSGPGAVPTAAPLRRATAEDLALVAAHLDAGFYLRAHPEVAASGVLPAVHYLAEGAAQGFDPTPWFSTSHYLRRYPDIARSPLNPFVHYLRWGRGEQREAADPIAARRAEYAPLVSVIVPNYRHAAFLPQRLESVAAQTWRNWELIVLDDASGDDSLEVIHRTLARLGVEAQVVANDSNSGSPFRQWRKGLSLARGEIVWICESDDFCEPDFLERLVPHFADPSVMLAMGRIQFADTAGAPVAGLDTLRERAEPGIWDAPLVRPAASWFRRGFGTFNCLSNVGGGLFRNVRLPDEVWARAEGMRICGDWLLYLHLAGSGQIAYEPAAVAYFRQHGANTSAGNFDKLHYYQELAAVFDEMIRAWALPEATRRAFLDKVRAEWRHWGLGEGFEEVFDETRLLEAGEPAPHVLLGFGGFQTGGGELFPINLANALLAQGQRVSMLATSLDNPNEDMRRRLDPRVPVYHARHLVEGGRGRFLAEAGVTAAHTHVMAADLLLLDLGPPLLEVPYLATLHGSHAGVETAAPALAGRLATAVDRWIYTADRNLALLAGQGVDPARILKLDNAMPPDPRPARFTREDLGLAAGDVVFAMVARGIPRKGWRAAVDAFRALRGAHPEARLLLVGEGPATDEARARAADLPGVTFLGYQSEINGILRMSDVLIVPSRFQGESYPLCVIQALQEGVPVIATSLGEIPAMLSTEDGRLAGLLLPEERDTARFAAGLGQAMTRLCGEAARGQAAAAARDAGRKFDMGRVAAAYRSLYEELARERLDFKKAAVALGLAAS